ncbi:MAG: FAD-binding oxidoreductase [Pseudomonadota bacterium]
MAAEAATAIANERPALADSLWTATANPSPQRASLTGVAEADTVVIGGGFTGLSAALHVAEAGQTVILLEAETPGWGASGRNGGQVNPALKPNPDDLVARFGDDLGRRMVKRWGDGGSLVFNLIARHGIEADARPVGFLRVATSEKTLQNLRDIAGQWRGHGADYDDVTAEETTRLVGADAYIGGVIDRRGGNIHPLNYALGLADAAERAGATLYANSPATGFVSDETEVTVTTAQGEVRARRALICTNAYTGDFARPLGKTVVPVTSVQVATAPLSDNIARSILPEDHAPTDTRRLIFYFRKTADGRFVMGGRGAMGDGSIRVRQQALRAAATELYPQLGDTVWDHAWGGDVAMTRDSLPGLHRLAPNVMAGLGFNGRGVANATVMGTILADWALGTPEAALDFPVSEPRRIPFHAFRNIGLGATVAALRLLDRFRL